MFILLVFMHTTTNNHHDRYWSAGNREPFIGSRSVRRQIMHLLLPSNAAPVIRVVCRTRNDVGGFVRISIVSAVEHTHHQIRMKRLHHRQAVKQTTYFVALGWLHVTPDGASSESSKNGESLVTTSSLQVMPFPAFAHVFVQLSPAAPR